MENVVSFERVTWCGLVSTGKTACLRAKCWGRGGSRASRSVKRTLEPVHGNGMEPSVTPLNAELPSTSVFHLFISSLQFLNLVLVFYSSVSEYPSIS